MKYKTARRILCVLLCLLMLPINVASSEDATLMTANAYEVYFSGLTQVTLLSTSEGYYIAAQEAGNLAGLPNLSDDGMFSNTYTHITVALNTIPSRNHDGTVYYALREMLNALEVFHYYGKTNGALYYNAVYKNIAVLLDTANAMLGESGEQGRYYADLLDDMLFHGNLAYGVGWIWENVIPPRISSLWGAQLNESMRSLIAELMLPFDGSDANLFAIMSAINEPLNQYSEVILDAEELYESAREFIELGEYMAGSDPFLFATEGTWALRNSLEAVQAVNSGDIIKFDEILDIGTQMISISAASDIFTSAMEHALPYADGSSSLYEPMIHSKAAELLELYHVKKNENEAKQLAWLAQNGIEGVAANTGDYLFANLSFGSLAVVDAMRTYLDLAMNMTKKTTAVLSLKRLVLIQDMFRSIYDSQIDSGNVDITRALAAKGAAIMYLKCYWNAADHFAFDKSLSASVEVLQHDAEAAILRLTNLCDSMFYGKESTNTIPANALTDTTAFNSGETSVQNAEGSKPAGKREPLFVAGSYAELLSGDTAPWIAPKSWGSIQIEVTSQPQITQIPADAFGLLDMNGDGSLELIVAEITKPNDTQVLQYDGGMASVADGELHLYRFSVFSMYENKVILLAGSSVDQVDYPFIGISNERIIYTKGHGTSGIVEYTFLVYNGGADINSLYFGDYVEAPPDENKHYKVNFDGIEGWMGRQEYHETMSKYLSKNKSVFQGYDNTEENRSNMLP